MKFKRSVTLCTVDQFGNVCTNFKPALQSIPKDDHPVGYMWYYPQGVDPKEIKLLISNAYNTLNHHVFTGEFIKPNTRSPIEVYNDITPPTGNQVVTDHKVVYDVTYNSDTHDIRVIYHVLFLCSDIIHLYSGQNYGKEGYSGSLALLPSRLKPLAYRMGIL